MVGWRVLGELQQGLGGWVASVRGTSAGLGWLVTGLSLWRPGFETTSVNVEFGVDAVAMGEVFPCSYHSTIALYLFIGH